MKASLVLILAASAAVVGCARSPNPAVVSTPAVIERTQVQTPAAGATSCQNHLTYKCNSGTWEQQAGPAC